MIREDPKNRNLLYLGTEYAFYISLNGGKDWKRFMTGLPTVRIDDILVHPRDNDLIVGTHGRSIWIIDDITPLQQMSDAVTQSDVHLFDVRPATRCVEDTMLTANGLDAGKHFRGTNPQGGTAISYFLKAAVPAGRLGAIRTGSRSRTSGGTTVREMDGTNEPGINRVQWNLGAEHRVSALVVVAASARAAAGAPHCTFINAQAVEPGTYLVKLAVGGEELTSTVLVEADNLR